MNYPPSKNTETKNEAIIINPSSKKIHSNVSKPINVNHPLSKNVETRNEEKI